MQVNYYYRHQHASSFSIENVFQTVKQSLPSTCVTRDIFAHQTFDLKFLFKINSLEADIHHITGAINYAVFGLPPKRTILTVHDIGHLLNTLRGAKKQLYKALFWSLPLKKVKYLTAISEFTKQQLTKELGVNHKLIRTIYNPVSSIFSSTPLPQNDRPVILQVGSGANKNIECLLSAVEGLPCKLLLVRAQNPVLIKQLNEKRIDFEFRSSLTRDELAKTYAECDLLYFASLYEGFGLPIIEAMACGRPVITSDIDPMKEVAGGAACLVDNRNSDQLRKSILHLGKSKDYKMQLIEMGKQRALDFSSEKIANNYYELYKDVLKYV